MIVLHDDYDCIDAMCAIDLVHTVCGSRTDNICNGLILGSGLGSFTQDYLDFERDWGLILIVFGCGYRNARVVEN